MGATASREFNDAVMNCVDRGDNFESLLEDPDVVNSTSSLMLALLTVIQFARRCKAFYQALTPIAQKRLDLTLHQPQVKRGNNFLSRLQQVQEADICIPKRLEPIYTSWNQPTVFFNPSERLKGASTASQLYEHLRLIDQRKVDDPIRRRIYAVALHDLRVQMDGNDYLNLKRKFRNRIVRVIFESSIVNDSLEDVEKWTTLYLKFGERMKWIAGENGGLGALIIIPLSLFSLHQ